MTELVCPTCLSLNRRQFQLDIDKYGSLFGDKFMMENVKSVCWECSSLFNKAYKFKLRVVQAQECLRSTHKKVTSPAPLSDLTCSIINFNDICCDQNIESLNQDDRLQKSLVVIKNDVKKIKSEMFIEEDNNDSEYTCLKDDFITINISGIKTDENEAEINETQIDNTSGIKNESDSDEILSKETAVKKLPINTVNLLAKVEKTKTNLKRNQTIKIEKDVKRMRVEKKKKKRKLIVSKDNYIIINMTEEEMLAARESARQTDRYKNRVKFRCTWCIVGFFDKDLYEKHMRTRHSEKAGAHQCQICETRFTSTYFYREHMEGHYKKYKCKACEFVGYKLSEMISHDAKEHAVRRFTCKVCLEEFPSPSSLRFHRETTHQAPAECKSCAKTFTTMNGLRVHNQKMHSHEPKSQCTVCGTRVRYLQSHMRKHRAAPEAAYCAECDQKFKCAEYYKTHLKYSVRHRAESVLSHVCKECDAKFVNASGLRKHMLARHSTVRPFKCDRCGKGFEAQCKLKLHIRHIHDGEEKPKDKICHICGRGFNTKSMLANHIRVHTGEKPFTCDICSAAFNQKSHLTTHTRGVHLKVKQRPSRGRRA